MVSSMCVVWFGALHLLVILTGHITNVSCATAEEQNIRRKIRKTTTLFSTGTDRVLEKSNRGYLARQERLENAEDETPARHDACEKNEQCLNGGKCHRPDDDEPNIRHCHCPPGFSGYRCEKYCPLDCQHGGICHQNMLGGSDRGDANSVFHYNHDTSPRDPNLDKFSCKCMGHFKGRYCEIPYENCPDGSQCLYGGKCQEERFSKKNPIDESSTTQEDTDGDGLLSAYEITVYECLCPEGYGGLSCQIVEGGDDEDHSSDVESDDPHSRIKEGKPIEVTRTESSSSDDEEKRRLAFAVAMTLLMFAAIILIVVADVRRRKQERELSGVGGATARAGGGGGSTSPATSGSNNKRRISQFDSIFRPLPWHTNSKPRGKKKNMLVSSPRGVVKNSSESSSRMSVYSEQGEYLVPLNHSVYSDFSNGMRNVV